GEKVFGGRMEQSDGELLSACRRGEEAAWEMLVRRYQRLIYTIPRRAGLDEDLASDVFQEVFATLFEKLDEIEQPERLKAWLVTTARRKTWRSISRANRLQPFDDEDDETTDTELNRLPDDAPLPDEVLIQLEEQHRVQTALAALDERCASLLSLLFYQAEPPSYAEIAARTGTREGSIGPTRARCLQKLLRLLEK
ncbi:MAG TPA: sigma-70 family RNA polymerase sigma factor, partial [Pyrinomonadaceae bacterium]|nr:sigma-70 family RNA polymerase sigma factor [Pyrinomonadaceae bacterium]